MRTRYIRKGRPLLPRRKSPGRNPVLSPSSLGSITLAAAEPPSPAWDKRSYEFIDEGVLYNRCHLIAFSLCGENDNECDLITGTRAMNVDGMEPLEEQTVRYIERTHNHVLYRVTPLFEEGELVARGVHMEAYSLEDDGAGLNFNVYCYNNQPGVVIDYVTGASRAA